MKTVILDFDGTIADTWYDIAMGSSAGCVTCGVTYGNHSAATLREHGADYVVDDLRRLWKKQFLNF